MVTVTKLICSMILLVTVESLDPLNTLRMVHLVFRHGDRAPVSLYPNDPYNNISSEIWPEGLGQLTKIGKAMEYNLGLWLRNRYDGFIKRVFDPKEINVVSTDVDRTLMSAECVMSAFYRPDNEVKFREDLSWMPIPIHTSPYGDDKLLNIDGACPRVASELSNLQNISEIQDFNEKNADLYRFISENSGANITKPMDLLLVYDAVRIERLYNLTVPDWALKTYDEMKCVSDFFYEMYSYTFELKRLRGGPLLKTITENMRNKSLGDLPKRKMVVYSAHDSTVSTLLNSMGVYNGIAPPYASTVMIELHQTEMDYFVKIYYQNDTSLVNAAYELKLPGCSLECPLSDFISQLQDVIPNDWEKECHSIDPLQNYPNTSSNTGSP